jgi:hypothetical protein
MPRTVPIFQLPNSADSDIFPSEEKFGDMNSNF